MAIDTNGDSTYGDTGEPFHSDIETLDADLIGLWTSDFADAFF